MKRRDLPIVGRFFEAGASDRVYDSLLLIAPAVIALLVLAGRSAVTAAVVVAYLVAFVSYVLYRGVSRTT